MRARQGASTAGTLTFLALVAVLAEAGPAAAADPGPKAYVETLRPLLAERYFSCHGGLKQEAGLRLDTVALMAAGGESGPAIVKGSAEG